MWTKINEDGKPVCRECEQLLSKSNLIDYDLCEVNGNKMMIFTRRCSSCNTENTYVVNGLGLNSRGKILTGLNDNEIKIIK